MNILLFLIPILTGLSSVLWLQITRVNPIWAMGSNILGYSLVALYYFFNRSVATIHISNSYLIGLIIVQGLLVTLVSIMWIMTTTNNIPLAVVGFVEIGYPLFIVLFSAIMLKEWNMNIYHCVGGGIILIGTMFVLFGNQQISLDAK